MQQGSTLIGRYDSDKNIQISFHLIFTQCYFTPDTSENALGNIST